MVIRKKRREQLPPEESKASKAKRYATGTAQALGSLVVGQQAIRSGIPRLLGVRLETHSTSNDRAKQILKNGGYLDPDKSGQGAIKSFEVLGLDPKEAKGKVYITGIHKNAKPLSNTPFVAGVDPNDLSYEQKALSRINQRLQYRTQAYLDYDKLPHSKQIKKLQKRLDKIVNANIRRPGLIVTTDPKALEKHKRGVKAFNKANQKANSIANRILDLRKDNLANLQKQRALGVIKTLLTGRGKDLYIGGSDNFFNQNFLPDFDDPMAMYSPTKVKVYGNRWRASAAAIKRESLGNLIKGNPNRVLAGAAILGTGGYLATKLGKQAKNSFMKDSQVERHKRTSSKGKTFFVSAFRRKNKPSK